MSSKPEKQMLVRQLMVRHQRHPGNGLLTLFKLAVEAGEIPPMPYHQIMAVWQLVEASANMTNQDYARIVEALEC